MIWYSSNFVNFPSIKFLRVYIVSKIPHRWSLSGPICCCICIWGRFWYLQSHWMVTCGVTYYPNSLRLNGYLRWIDQSNSDLCVGGVKCETVEHFLLRYTRWNEQRDMLAEAAGPYFSNLSRMLDGKLESVDGTNEPNGRAWKPDTKIVRAVIAFAM